MKEESLNDIIKRLNVLISLALRQLSGDSQIGEKDRRKQRIGDVSRYLASMGLDAKDIADITGSPVASVRTLLTPKRRK